MVEVHGGEMHGEAVRGVIAGLAYHENASRGKLVVELIEASLLL
jgi:hypothetical protein